MNKIIVVLLFFFSCTAFAQMDMGKKSNSKSAQMHENVPTKDSDTKTVYTCPMHPEVISDKPGKCPKCGMNLVPKTIVAKTEHAHSDASMSANHSIGKISFEGKTVRYDLYVKDTIVNFSGKKRRAIATNGRLAAPTLYFKEGDTAEIYLHNQLKENTGFHWHGVILPNEMDGVPYLTTKPIKPGETHLYKFKVAQNGTYWYHSHESTQEQIGMNGMLIFEKRDDDSTYKAEIPMLLGDWSNDKPQQIMRRLHMANTDWYAIKKNAVQSYSEAIATGNFKTKLLNEWKRMEAMDVSDVYYENFLVNGNVEGRHANLKAGDKVRMRIANGAASTNFWINFGGGKFKVIASDGNDVEPVEVERFIVGISETYDVELTIPDNKSYEFRATAEDRTGHTSFWLGSGEKINAPDLPRLLLFEGMKMMNGMMKMSGDMKPMNMTMGNHQMDMNSVMYPEIPAEERQMMMKHMDEMMQPAAKNSAQNHLHQMNSSDAKYVCPMHPEVGSDKPGKCPKCGMDLVKNNSEKMEMNGMGEGNHFDHTKKPEMYVCPMHPEVTSDKPGKCPKCGMDLVKNNSEKTEMTSMGEMNHFDHDASSGPLTLTYEMLRASEKTVLPDENVRELKFTLEGNMNHYLWTLDNKTVTETDKILIKKGEVLRIVMYNNSMMRHPMHLHGHDFRLVNSQGEYSPLKNVVDIMPMETDTIEFAANQDGDWFFHCHLLYHMMTGMGRVFSYENSKPNPQLPDKTKSWKEFLKDNFMVSSMAMVDLHSNMMHAETMTMIGPRWANVNSFHSNWDFSHYNGDFKIGRYLGKFQWAMPYVGFRIQQSHEFHEMKEMHMAGMSHGHKTTLFGQNLLPKYRNTPIVGLSYVLPWLITADASVDMNGKIVLELGREDIPISPRFRGNISYNTDREFETGLKYIISKWLTIGGNYSSEMGWGAGIGLVY